VRTRHRRRRRTRLELDDGRAVVAESTRVEAGDSDQCLRKRQRTEYVLWRRTLSSQQRKGTCQELRFLQFTEVTRLVAAPALAREVAERLMRLEIAPDLSNI
jgi:hypothetical protein